MKLLNCLKRATIHKLVIQNAVFLTSFNLCYTPLSTEQKNVSQKHVVYNTQSKQLVQVQFTVAFEMCYIVIGYLWPSQSE